MAETSSSKLRGWLERRRQVRLEKAYRRSHLGGRPGEAGRPEDAVNRATRDSSGAMGGYS